MALVRPVIDLHCDLLMSLGESGAQRDQDPTLRCSYPQLIRGGVALQTLALFTETGRGSHTTFAQQLNAFDALSGQRWQRARFPLEITPPTVHTPVQVILAIENASGVLEEDEPLSLLFERLQTLVQRYGPLLYISLTWNTENRFGGGNATDIGLKEDGARLVEYLAGPLAHGCLALDLSHTSDRLAQDILNKVEKDNLQLALIASHSNFRAIQDHPRNLPDDIAKAIIQRKGVIGLNFIRGFIGAPFEEKFLEHISYGISLGATEQLCFGSDFFCDSDTPNTLNSLRPFFDEIYSDATTYPQLLGLIEKKKGADFAADIAYKNMERFLVQEMGAHVMDFSR